MKASKFITIPSSVLRAVPVILFAVVMLASRDTHAQQRKLSLKQALDQAEGANKELQIQKLEVMHQKERTKEIKGRMLPSLNFHSTISHYFDRQVIFLPGSFAGTQKDVQDVAVGGLNALNAVVSLSQPLLSEGTRHQRKTAAIAELMEEEKTTDFRSELRFAVTRGYFEVVVLQKELELHENSLKRNNREFEDSKALFAQGRALKSDTLKSFIAVENTKSAISFLRSSITLSGLRLQRLLGLDGGQELILTDMMIPADDMAEFIMLKEEYMEAETLSRPDIKLQELSIQHQGSLLKSIRGEKLPQLSLIGQYQVQSQSDDLNLGNYTYPETTFLGLQLYIPLFNGNKLTHQSRQAKIRIEQEKLKLTDLTQEARLEITGIVSNWEDASSKLTIHQKTVEAAELHYSMINNRYRNGLSSKLELSDAELSLTQAQQHYLKTIFDIKILTAELKMSMGKL